MASLDELEGDAIELVVLVVIIIIALLAFGLWKGFAGFDPSKAIAQILKKIWNSIDSVFSKAVDGLTNTGSIAGYGSDQVVTGSDLIPNEDLASYEN
jgi:hypothetical protein